MPSSPLTMPSSVIRRFRYNPERRELDLLFTSGRRYRYREVPEAAASAFAAAFAKGVHFNRRIRDRYPFVEVTDAEDPVDLAGAAQAWIDPGAAPRGSGPQEGSEG